MNLNLKSMNLNLEIRNKINGSNQYHRYKGGGKGGRTALMAACAPPFWFTKNTAFETLCNDKTTDNDGKSNNYV